MGVTTPGGLQMISYKEFKYYLEQTIAVPGSKQTIYYENDSVPENKMILQHLVPDIGTIKTRWIYPPVVKRSVCFDSSEAHILTCINAAVNKLLESDQPDIQDVFTKSWNFIEKVLLEPKCDDKSILNYYKDLLHRVLWLSEKTIT